MGGINSTYIYFLDFFSYLRNLPNYMINRFLTLKFIDMGLWKKIKKAAKKIWKKIKKYVLTALAIAVIIIIILALVGQCSSKTDCERYCENQPENPDWPFERCVHQCELNKEADPPTFPPTIE